MIFKIPLENGRIVYMSFEFDLPNDYYDVVWVDAKKFREIWGDKENYQSPNQWKAWKRYPDAEKAFKNSKTYPVPVADAGYINHPEDGKMHLTNGITRTTWLLINGAKAFPISCNPKETQLFKALIGI